MKLKEKLAQEIAKEFVPIINDYDMNMIKDSELRDILYKAALKGFEMAKKLMAAEMGEEAQRAANNMHLHIGMTEVNQIELASYEYAEHFAETLGNEENNK